MIQWIIFSTERAGRPWVVFSREWADSSWLQVPFPERAFKREP